MWRRKMVWDPPIVVHRSSREVLVLRLFFSLFIFQSYETPTIKRDGLDELDGFVLLILNTYYQTYTITQNERKWLGGEKCYFEIPQRNRQQTGYFKPLRPARRFIRCTTRSASLATGLTGLWPYCWLGLCKTASFFHSYKCPSSCLIRLRSTIHITARWSC
jgi:hypothetical protein